MPQHLRLLTYNILRGGLGRERALAEVIAAAQPDLVILQEATRPAAVERIAGLAGMTVVGARRGRSLAFISRVPIAEHRWVRPRWSQHAFLEVLPEGTDLRIVGVHLSAVHAAWTEARRVHELRSLLAAIAGYQATPHLVLGDFNTLAPDERLDVSRLPHRLRLLVWLSGGRIRWQTIAIMLGADYQDAFRRLHAGEPGRTFPTWDPYVRLDYAFVPNAVADRLVACDVISAPAAVRVASDHLPLRVVFSLEPANNLLLPT